MWCQLMPAMVARFATPGPPNDAAPAAKDDAAGQAHLAMVERLAKNAWLRCDESTEGVIGALDVPDLFLDPARVKTARLWFGRGHVECQFPNNAKALKAELEALEFLLELSSEVPGTNANWPSDISLWVNETKICTWTSPGDFGDRRGRFTPRSTTLHATIATRARR